MSDNHTDDNSERDINHVTRVGATSPTFLEDSTSLSSLEFDEGDLVVSSPICASSPLQNRSSPISQHSTSYNSDGVEQHKDLKICENSSVSDLSLSSNEIPRKRSRSLHVFEESVCGSGDMQQDLTRHEYAGALDLHEEPGEEIGCSDGSASNLSVAGTLDMYEEPGVELGSSDGSDSNFGIDSVSSGRYSVGENVSEVDNNEAVSSPAASIAVTSSESDVSLDCFDNSLESDDSVSMLYRDSTVSTHEAVLGLCELYLKNKLTKKSLSDIIKYLNQILPKPNFMPETLGQFLNYVSSFAPPLKEECYFYCCDCLQQKLNFKDVCNNAGCRPLSSSQIFYVLPLKCQIQHLFEKRGLAAAIDSYRNSRVLEDGCLRDILDGYEMRKVKEIYNGTYDINLLVNLDGFSTSSSSVAQIWPVMCTICEVAPILRRSFTFVASIWSDKKEPNMDMYVKPFVDSLVQIHAEGGVMWQHPSTGEKIKSMVTAPLVCADAPARALIQNVKRFNGKYGCNSCEVKSQKVPVTFNREGVATKHLRYYVYSEEISRLRSGDRMSSQARLAQQTRQSVKGVKGPSPFSPVPALDVGKCVYPEYLHALLLGVVNTFVPVWRFEKDILHQIDNLLLSIKPPDFITRMPRGLSSYKMWKAQEFRTWLLYYSLPILSQFMPEAKTQHWILLVASSFLLLKECISESDLNASDLMLRMFVREVSQLYSVKEYKYNVHQLLHFPLTVQRWGPLWSNSAFLFEDMNGYLGNQIHGTKHKGKELVNNLKLIQGILSIKSTGIQVTVERDFPFECSVLGAPVQVHLNDAQYDAVRAEAIDPYTSFARAKYKTQLYTSKCYDERVKRCNSCVSFTSVDGKKSYGEIVSFLKCNNGIFCLVDVFSIDHLRLFFHKPTRYKVTHIIPVNKSGKSVVVKIENLKMKLIKVLDYVCIPPNCVEINL